MKRILAPMALGLAAAAISGCVGWHGRGHPATIHFVAHPYVVWYDGFYGPFYDGYWGVDGYFYFRLDSLDRAYRQGDPDHFRRDNHPSNQSYKRYEGNQRNPPSGTRMPSYP